mmetsp:Transcript_19295/g.58359  ORF Transcript_19295/g.58359 Transcript_19295/m.58359 type:complete len:253 (+) Transcript_19295:539-1297(+)
MCCIFLANAMAPAKALAPSSPSGLLLRPMAMSSGVCLMPPVRNPAPRWVMLFEQSASVCSTGVCPMPSAIQRAPSLPMALSSRTSARRLGVCFMPSASRRHPSSLMQLYSSDSRRRVSPARRISSAMTGMSSSVRKPSRVCWSNSPNSTMPSRAVAKYSRIHTAFSSCHWPPGAASSRAAATAASCAAARFCRLAAAGILSSSKTKGTCVRNVNSSAAAAKTPLRVRRKKSACGGACASSWPCVAMDDDGLR